MGQAAAAGATADGGSPVLAGLRGLLINSSWDLAAASSAPAVPASSSSSGGGGSLAACACVFVYVCMCVCVCVCVLSRRLWQQPPVCRYLPGAVPVGQIPAWFVVSRWWQSRARESERAGDKQQLKLGCGEACASCTSTQQQRRRRRRLFACMCMCACVWSRHPWQQAPVCLYLPGAAPVG